MGASDAATAQGMATRHVRSVKAVVAGVGEINALLAKMMKKGKIKWNGFGTHALWYVRKLKEESSWNSGQLRTRDFEEKDPMDEATLPFCFIDETYAISEKSVKTNRAAGGMKLYGLQKENARNAQTAMYRAFVSALYSDGSDALVPVGLDGITGRFYENSNKAYSYNGALSYGGIELFASQITTWNANYATHGWTKEYWYPTVNDQALIPSMPSTPLWSTHCIYYLQAMCQAMSRTADVSGTGKVLKPDLALMGTDPWAALQVRLAISQKDVAGVPLGTTAPALANFTTVRVGSLDVVYDENVPDDVNSIERVFILDSKAFYIHSCNTKSEGLIEGKWTGDDVDVAGGRGMYKSNWALICETPQATGLITGCDG